MRHVAQRTGMVVFVTAVWFGWASTAAGEPVTLGQVYALAIQQSEDLQKSV